MTSSTTDGRLRLTVLTTSFPLHRDAQSGIFVERLVDELSRSIEVTVLTPCGTTMPDSMQRSYRVRCFGYAPRRWQLLCHQPGGLPAALRRNRWLYGLLPLLLLSMLGACFAQARRDDLIFANWSISGAIAGLVGRVLRKPVVTTLRGTDVNASTSSLPLRMVMKSCLSLSHKVVLVSQEMRESLASLYPHHEGKLAVIPNGVGEDLVALPAVGEERKAEDHSITLLSVANLVAGKGIDVLLRALPRIRGRCSLVIVGDGPQRASLESLAQRLLIGDAVTFVGQVAPDRVKDYLRSADIFVLPSYSEGRPNSLIEAMAAGRAVVATDIAGVRELVDSGSNGLLVAPGKAELLAEALDAMVGDFEQRRAFGRAARETILDAGLSWARTALQYRKLFHDSLPDRRGQSELPP